jgi:hypothetical protein
LRLASRARAAREPATRRCGVVSIDALVCILKSALATSPHVGASTIAAGRLVIQYQKISGTESCAAHFFQPSSLDHQSQAIFRGFGLVGERSI